MTNKLIFGIVMLLLISGALAYTDDDKYLCWDFDEGSGSTAVENISELRNLELTNTAWDSAEAKLGTSSLNMSGTTDRFQNQSATINLGQDFTFSLWVYYQKLNGDDNYLLTRFDNGLDDDKNWFFLMIDDRAGSDQMEVYLKNTGSVQINAPLPTLNDWTHYVIAVKSGDYMEIYRNGVHSANSTSINALSANSHCIRGGVNSQFCDAAAATGDIGLVDNMVLFNKTFNKTDVADEYNAGAGVACGISAAPPPPSPDSINISSPEPTSGSSFTVPFININATANSSSTFDATLYINGTIDQTISSFSSGENVLVDFNKTLLSGNYNYMIEMINTGGGEENTSVIPFSVDLSVSSIWSDNLGSLMIQQKFEGSVYTDNTSNNYGSNCTTCPTFVNDFEGNPNSAIFLNGNSSEYVEMNTSFMTQLQASATTTTCIRANALQANADSRYFAIWGSDNPANNDRVVLTANAESVFIRDGGAAVAQPVFDGSPTILNKWMCFMLNDTDDVYTYSMNDSQGSFQAGAIDTSAGTYATIGSLIGRFGSYAGHVIYYKTSTVDEFLIWNTSMSPDDLTSIFNGKGNDYDVAASSPYELSLNISGSQPTNGSTFDVTTINFNATVNSSYEFDADFYVNGVLNQTLTNFNPGVNVLIDFNQTFLEGSYNFTISASNIFVERNTTQNEFSIDTLTFANVFYPLNNSAFTTNNVTFNITVNSTADYNISLYIDNVKNETLGGAAAQEFLVEFNSVAPLNGGNHSFYFDMENEDGGTGTTPLHLFGIDTLDMDTTFFPATDTQHNTENVSFNITVNSTNPFDCHLMFNTTTNATGSFSSGTNVLASFLVGFGAEEVTLGASFRCFNSFNESEQTTNQTIYIDRINPIITPQFSNGTFGYNQNITGQFNFSDGFQIFSYNVSIDGTIQVAGADNVNTTTFTYNLNYNTSALTPENHTLVVTVADGHTAKTIPDYDWNNGFWNDHLKYTFPDGEWVNIQSNKKKNADSWKTEKKTDRYTFSFEPSGDKKANKQTLTITSSKYIHILETDSKYQEYLIIDDHWLDFVLPKDSGAKVKAKRINDYEVEIKLTGLNKIDKLEFDSIGDLNIVQQNFTFGVTNSTLTFSTPISELEQQEMILVIDTSSLINSTASLTYNGTGLTIVKTENADTHVFNATFLTPALPSGSSQENRTFTWDFTFVGLVANESAQFNGTQLVFSIGMDNCSTFGMTGVNFTLKDETNKSLLNGSMEAYFKVWVDDINNFTEFNLSWGGNNSDYGICIFPNGSNYTAYMQMEYSSLLTTYATELYYFINNTISNATQQISLYLTAAPTQVEFTVQDVNADPVEGAVIKVLSYDLETDTFATTEILVTDSDGIGLGQIIMNTEWYAFIIEVDGEVRLQTLPTKITSTSKRFAIGLEDTYIDRFTTTNGIAHSLTFTNATSQFMLVYSDPTGKSNEVCLDLTRRGLNGDVAINESCSSSSSGTILMTIPENTSTNSYIAVATAKFTGGETFFLDSITQSFNEAYKKFGLEGLFVAFLLILTVVLIGLWSPEIAVVFAILGTVISAILGIFFVSWGFIVTLVILGGLVIYKISRK